MENNKLKEDESKASVQYDESEYFCDAFDVQFYLAFNKNNIIKK